MQTTTQPTIKASELRIGNYVFTNGEPVMVEGICDSGINPEVAYYGGYAEGIEPEYYFESLQPIDLSPEILEKCGFNHIINILYQDQAFNYLLGGLFSRRYDKAVISVEVTYLHQLQNLYFALTGEELQITF